MPIKRAYNALSEVFHKESAGGTFLFIAAILAMLMANHETASVWYQHLLHVPVGLLLGGETYALSLSHFINDGLMAIFFLLVGLEIKRELIEGELSSRERALLPALAAAGGMIGPALIYAGFNWGDEVAMRGWAIPTATDIAFSLGVLSLLGRRVPVSLKIFLLAVAVIDDLGAIAIIAIFYSGDLATTPLLLSVLALFGLLVLNRAQICSRVPYMLLGLVLWGCVLKSGVHATLAGVAMAFTVPFRVSENKISPLPGLERDLHSLVTFFILPIFAFTNAGVSFAGLSLSVFLNSVPLGIMVGLLVGKIIGISGTVWVAVKLGIATLPRDCSWTAMISLSCLCGIGFTVSLFIGNLAFVGGHEELVNYVRLGVLTGSAVAGMLGYLMLRFVAFPHGAKAAENSGG